MAEVLFEEIILGGAAGGRKRVSPVTIEVERALVPADLASLEAGDSPAAPPAQGGILHIRYAHHQLARLLVTEGAALAEISLLTGYSPAYISNLKNDPAFKELLAHYEAQKELKFIDVLDRMKTLGLSVLDELQRRLEDDPEGFKKSELMSLADLTLLRSRSVGGNSGEGAGNSVGPVQVNVSFVAPSLPAPPQMRDITPQIEAAE